MPETGTGRLRASVNTGAPPPTGVAMRRSQAMLMPLSCPGTGGAAWRPDRTSSERRKVRPEKTSQ